MSRSYSSLLRSIPVYQAQLKRTAFRSFAPAAGVYSGPPPRPLPPPCPPPPPCSPPARPCAGACAQAVGSAPIVRTVAIATCATTILFMTALLVGVDSNRSDCCRRSGFRARQERSPPSGHPRERHSSPEGTSL